MFLKIIDDKLDERTVTNALSVLSDSAIKATDETTINKIVDEIKAIVDNKDFTKNEEAVTNALLGLAASAIKVTDETTINKIVDEIKAIVDNKDLTKNEGAIQKALSGLAASARKVTDETTINKIVDEIKAIVDNKDLTKNEGAVQNALLGLAASAIKVTDETTINKIVDEIKAIVDNKDLTKNEGAIQKALSGLAASARKVTDETTINKIVDEIKAIVDNKDLTKNEGAIQKALSGLAASAIKVTDETTINKIVDEIKAIVDNKDLTKNEGAVTNALLGLAASARKVTDETTINKIVDEIKAIVDNKDLTKNEGAVQNALSGLANSAIKATDETTINKIVDEIKAIVDNKDLTKNEWAVQMALLGLANSAKKTTDETTINKIVDEIKAIVDNKDLTKNTVAIQLFTEILFFLAGNSEVEKGEDEGKKILVILEKILECPKDKLNEDGKINILLLLNQLNRPYRLAVEKKEEILKKLGEKSDIVSKFEAVMNNEKKDGLLLDDIKYSLYDQMLIGFMFDTYYIDEDVLNKIEGYLARLEEYLQKSKCEEKIHIILVGFINKVIKRYSTQEASEKVEKIKKLLSKLDDSYNEHAKKEEEDNRLAYKIFKSMNKLSEGEKVDEDVLKIEYKGKNIEIDINNTEDQPINIQRALQKAHKEYNDHIKYREDLKNIDNDICKSINAYNDSGNVDNNNWYTSDHIAPILYQRLSDANIEIGDALILSNADSSNAPCTQAALLSDHINTLNNGVSSTGFILNLNNAHWVSVRIVLTNNVYEVMIADSLLAPQDEVIDFISESLNNRNITIHYSYMENRLIQEDFNSCGAFAIENLIRMMEGEAIGDNAGDIRAAHQQLLSTMRGVGDHDTEKNDVQTTKENNSTQKDNKKTISKEKDCEDPDNNKNGYNKEDPNGEGDDKKDVQYNYTTSIPKSFEIDIKKVKYTLTSGVNKESEGVDMMDIGMVDINKLSNDEVTPKNQTNIRETFLI